MFKPRIFQLQQKCILEYYKTYDVMIDFTSFFRIRFFLYSDKSHSTKNSFVIVTFCIRYWEFHEMIVMEVWSVKAVCSFFFATCEVMEIFCLPNINFVHFFSLFNSTLNQWTTQFYEVKSLRGNLVFSLFYDSCPRKYTDFCPIKFLPTASKYLVKSLRFLLNLMGFRHVSFHLSKK